MANAFSRLSQGIRQSRHIWIVHALEMIPPGRLLEKRLRDVCFGVKCIAAHCPFGAIGGLSMRTNLKLVEYSDWAGYQTEYCILSAQRSVWCARCRLQIL